MKMLRAPYLAAAFVALPALVSPCHAHEVHSHIRISPVAVVTLTYADGKPFAYEQFELTPKGADIPSQVGRTDAQGRIAVLPVDGKALTLSANSKDGHGLRLEIPASPADATTPQASEGELPRWLKLAAGGGILFGLFGLYQLFTRRSSAQ